jgi:hypothetical protein
MSTQARPQSLAAALGSQPHRLTKKRRDSAQLAHQLNDWRTCGTSTECDRRASCAASPSAAGACARALPRKRASAPRCRAAQAAPQRARLAVAALLRVSRRSSAGASAPLLAAAGEAHAEARRTCAAVASLPAMAPRPVTQATGVPAAVRLLHQEQALDGLTFGGWAKLSDAGFGAKAWSSVVAAARCTVQGGSTRKKLHAQETSQRPARSAGAIF